MASPPSALPIPLFTPLEKAPTTFPAFTTSPLATTSRPVSPSKYSATAGYDLCTGWGTMIGSNLMQALLAPPSENLAHHAAPGFYLQRTWRRAFYRDFPNLHADQYRLDAVELEPGQHFALAHRFLHRRHAQPRGAASTVTVSLNSAASNFLIGNYSGNVSIANLTDGTAQNRQFDLYVGNGGFETGDFTDWNFVGSTNLSLLWPPMTRTWLGPTRCPAQPMRCSCIRGFMARTSASALRMVSLPMVPSPRPLPPRPVKNTWFHFG